MRNKQIPSKDIEFDNFQNNFMARVVLNATAWGIPAAVVAVLQGLQSPWAAIWAVTKIKTTRTTQQVTEKDAARSAYEAVLRQVIQQYIMVNANISDGDREALEIKPRATERTPVPAPSTVPVIEQKPLSGNRMQLYYRQEAAEPGTSGRGKPYGVAYCEFAYKVGGAAPVTPEECSLRLNPTRSPFIAEFAPAQAGQKVYGYARWVNSRGEAGAWTNVNEFIIP